MLIPKRTKYRKQFRGKIGGLATKGNKVDFGEFGLAATEFGWITSRQIEACRITINRTFKREGKIWIRIFPDKPYTKRPEGTRMGKGKGNTEGWVAVVKRGKIMLANEIRNMSVDELLTQEKELKQELFNLKFQKTLGQLQDTAKIRTVKRDIARIKTILTEKTKTDK